MLAHARALLTSSPEGKSAYLQADIQDPERSSRHPLIRDSLDFSQPVALILIAVLHFFADEDEPGRSSETLLGALPSGSYVVASHGTAEYSPAASGRGNVYTRSGVGITGAGRRRVRGPGRSRA